MQSTGESMYRDIDNAKTEMTLQILETYGQRIKGIYL